LDALADLRKTVKRSSVEAEVTGALAIGLANYLFIKPFYDVVDAEFANRHDVTTAMTRRRFVTYMIGTGCGAVLAAETLVGDLRSELVDSLSDYLSGQEAIRIVDWADQLGAPLA
jgi:hypothetical protein